MQNYTIHFFLFVLIIYYSLQILAIQVYLNNRTEWRTDVSLAFISCRVSGL